MALGFDEKKDLEKVLEVIVKQLMQKGLLPALSNVEQKDLIKNVSENLSGELTKEDLNKESSLKALSIACVSECVQMKNPNYKFDYKLLFKPQNQIDPDELTEQLKNIFKEAIKLNPNYNPKSSSVDEKLDELANRLVNKSFKSNDNDALSENEKTFGLIAASIDLLSMQRRQFYGVDTQTPGEVQQPVLEIIGNLVGAQDLATEGTSFMAEVNKPDLGVPDPLGIKLSAVLDAISSNEDVDIQNELLNAKLIPSTAPTNKPPGYK